MSSYFSSTGTRIGANTATGEVKAFDSAKFHEYTTDDNNLGQEELKKALKDLGGFSDTEAAALATSIISEHGKAPTYDELMAILDGDGDGKVQSQEVRVAAEVAANGGKLKSGEGIKDLQNASKLFNDQNNLDSEKVKGVLANLIDSNGKLLTGTGAQDAEDQILLALLGVGASEAEVTTILNAIHNGTDGDRKNIVAEIINSAGGSTQEQERSGITSSASTRKAQFGDVKGATGGNNPGTTFTKDAFINQIKGSDANTIDNAKLEATLVSMGVAKDATAATALREQLIESYKASHNGTAPKPDELFEFIKKHDKNSDGTIEKYDVSFSVFETVKDGDVREFNKDRLAKFLDNASPEMKEKALKAILKDHAKVPEGEIQGVYDKLIALGGGAAIAEKIVGSEANAVSDKVKTNIEAFKGTTGGNTDNKYTSQEFADKIKKSDGGIDDTKFKDLLVSMGLAPDATKAEELRKQLVASYKASKGGDEPDAKEMADFINAHNTGSDKIDLDEVAFSTFETTGDPRLYNKDRLKAFIDNAKPEVKEKVLKGMIRMYGEVPDGEVQGVYDKIKDKPSQEIVNTLIGADKADAKRDEIKTNVQNLKGGGVGDPNKKFSKDEFRNAIKGSTDSSIDTGKLAKLLKDMGIAKDDGKASELAGKLLSLHGATSPDALYDALDNVIHKDNIIMKGDFVKGLFAKKEGDNIVYDKGSFKQFLDGATDDTKKEYLKSMFMQSGGLNEEQAKAKAEGLAGKPSQEIADYVFGANDKLDQAAFDKRVKENVKTYGPDNVPMSSTDIGVLDKTLSTYDFERKTKGDARNELLNPIRERRLDRIKDDSDEAIRGYKGKNIGEVADMMAGDLVNEAKNAGDPEKAVKDKFNELQGKMDKIAAQYPEGPERKAIRDQLMMTVMESVINKAVNSEEFGDDKRWNLMMGIGNYIKDKKGTERQDLQKAFFMGVSFVDNSEKMFGTGGNLDGGHGNDAQALYDAARDGNYKLLNDKLIYRDSRDNNDTIDTTIDEFWKTGKHPRAYWNVMNRNWDGLNNSGKGM